MIQLDNQTTWAAELHPGWGRDRKQQQTLVIKVGYSFDDQGQLTPLPQPPIAAADQYHGDPITSSLVLASETVPFKKGAEILLTGSAQPAQAGKATLQVRIGLRQGDKNYWCKELRVFGRRTWQRKFMAALPGKPETINQPVPLIYENAYGGSDPANAEQRSHDNPAGVGYSLRGLRTKELSIPQIEIGPDFISNPASRVQPAGFAPLSPHWNPRSKETVQIDSEAIAYGGCPWSEPPSESLYNCAPLDQRFEQPFAGELALSLKGLVAEATSDVLIKLPAVRPQILLETVDETTELQAQCDTLIINADEQQIHLLFRTAIPFDAKNEAPEVVFLFDPDAEEEEDSTESVEASA